MISIIVATDKNLLIGQEASKNGIPWSVPEDLKHFKETTLNKTVLMGYTTYKAIGRPLPNRKTIVVTLEEFNDDRVEIRYSLDEVLNEYKDSEDVLYVSGGASIYKQSLPYASELLMSRIPGEYEGETYFPDFDEYGFNLVETIDKETFKIERYIKR